jgi:hypothetical protein
MHGQPTWNGVSKVLLKPLEKRGNAVEILPPEPEAVGHDGDVFVPGFGPGHIRKHKFAGKVLGSRDKIVDFSGVSPFFHP